VTWSRAVASSDPDARTRLGLREDQPSGKMLPWAQNLSHTCSIHETLDLWEGSSRVAELGSCSMPSSKPSPK